MKSYADHLNEISSANLLEGLLAHGMFTSKLPPFLSSVDFFNHLQIEKYEEDNKWRDYVRYESLRNINIPRQLAIPSPFAYAQSCKYLSEEWDKVKERIIEQVQGHKHKISRVHLRKMARNEPLFEMNYKNFGEDGWPEVDLLVKSNYLVHADISNCFPSIYTHSIAWALVGKAKAKTEVGRQHKEKWFNRIDEYLRNFKNGETNGVLIGPHSSNLMSEIILTSVDNNLYKKGYKYIRHIDDYKCYVSSYDEAERFLIDLTSELKVYELTLNHKKTEILNLPLFNEKPWLRELKRFQFSSFSNINGGDNFIHLRSFFSYLDLALEEMTKDKNSGSAILNYAIKTLSSFKINPNAVKFYFSRIHHLILVYPYLIQILDTHVFEPFSIDITTIEKLSKDIFELGMEKQLYEPCSFALFFSLKYSFDLGIESLSKKAIDSDDCIFMLLAYLSDYSLNNSTEDYVIHAKAIVDRNDFDRFWLFVYEVQDNIEFDVNFKKLKEDGVSFLKEAYSKHNLGPDDLPF